MKLLTHASLNRFIGASAILAATLLTFSSPAHAWLRAWDESNDPGGLFEEYAPFLEDLPKSGKVKYAPWSDHYWPALEGGAARRWQTTGNSHPLRYQLASWKQVAAMSDEALNALSPAEKYDIVHGRYDYPLVQHEARRTSTSRESWEGLCHAVAVAATNYREPQTTIQEFYLPNGRIRRITFYSSDLKALLAHALDTATGDVGLGIGRRCESGSVSSSGACWDTNPGSFYIALTNMVGMLGDGLIVDVDPTREVWNAAVSSYSAKLTPKSGLSPKAARGTAREVRVDLKMSHSLGTKPSKSAVGLKVRERTYAFTLELDRDGQIIGGEWISTDRPDMLWTATLPGRLGGYYTTLGKMVRQNPISR